MMHRLQHLLCRKRRKPFRRTTPPDDHQAPPPEPIAFQDLYRQVESNDPHQRKRAATLLSALAPRTAIRPLLRSYMRHGEPFTLEALAAYGDKLTLVAGREVSNTSRSATHRARLMDVLAASDDPAALDILRNVIGDYEPVVHVSACAALVRLGDGTGIEHLADALLSTHEELRLLALRAASDLRARDPAIDAILSDHVDRYLAASGAVPKNVNVAMPLLLDPTAELPALITRHVHDSPHTLTIVIGPESAALAESGRSVFEEALERHALFFSTHRHSPPEQLDILADAQTAAASGRHRRVALIGELPSPQGLHPPPHFLTEPEGRHYTVRIVFVGQQEFAVVTEWWHYIEDHSELPTDFEVVLTALTIGGDRLTEEERLTYQLTEDYQADAFARALLAHRATVGDALEGRSWIY